MFLLMVIIGIAFFLLFVSPHAAYGATTAVIYESEFSSDPEWTTDQPENFYWDSENEVLFARTINLPDPDYSPSRHYYIETELNPRLSYEFTWDMNILTVEGGGTSGVAVFGLFGDNLYGFNELNLNFAGDYQDGTFSIRMMTLEGASRFIFTEVNPGSNYDIGEMTERSFNLNQWYTCTLTYNALSHTYHFEIRERDSGIVILTHAITLPDPEWPINPEFQNLGITMHPEGTGATNLAYAPRKDGFAEYQIDNVKLTQIYDETYDALSSVFFLPGIQASRLYTDGVLGTEDQLWEPNINGDVKQLAMTEVGESVEDIYTRDVIDSVLGITDIYESFLEYLASEKTKGHISDYEAYAYDWRYSVEDIAEAGTHYEDEVRTATERVKALAQHNNSKVTLIAHSNGGLLAKALVEELKQEDKAYLIDTIIFIAVPHFGTPKAIGSILHGFDQEYAWGLIADDETVRDVAHNMPGIYGLVPSEEYFAQSVEPIIQFENGTTTNSFVTAYGAMIDTHDELARFMAGSDDNRPEAETIQEAGKANSTMIGDAKNLHRDMLDDWVAPAGINVIDIVGVGLNTVRGFRYEEFQKRVCVVVVVGAPAVCGYDSYYEPVPLFTKYGDETVVDFSGEGYSGSKQTYYVDLNEVADVRPDDAKQHANITGLSELQQFIGGLIQGSLITPTFIYGEKPAFDSIREVVSVHSPVTLSLTDTHGRVVEQTIMNGHPHVTTDIPGSTYVTIGGATYIAVPNGTSYTATISGTGVAGSYTLMVDRYAGEGDPANVWSLSAATVTPQMSATFTNTAGIFSSLAIDYDGNVSIDESVSLAPEPLTSKLFTALRSTVGSFTKVKTKDRNWIMNALDRAEATGATKGYGSKAVLRIFEQIDERLVKYVAQGLITPNEYRAFTDIINRITTR